MPIFGEETQFIQPGVDPYAPPYKPRKRIPFRWMAFTIVGVVGICCGGLALMSKMSSAGRAEADGGLNPGSGGGSITPIGTLPDPSVQTVLPSATPSATGTATKITADLLLTQFALSATRTHTPSHFLTQLAYDDLNRTATMESLQPGTAVNVSGVDPNVTVVYFYPSETATPWVVSATPTATDRVVVQTVEVIRIISATPAPPLPTQTPWFYITQPPVVTIVWTREVEVTRLVTVVVTATPTDTPPPTDTPAPSETPTETPAP